MIIDNFLKYQIEWLTSHNDIEFNKEEEDLIIRFLRDTAEMYQRENECEDCISRDAVIKHICESKECYKDECKGRLYKRCFDLQWIYDLPSVTPQPKIGHWIDIMVGDMPAQACDRCNTFYPLAYTGGGHKYCPNCGAKMGSENQ